VEFYFAFAVNRRLDEWVKLHQLDLDSVENDVDEKVEDKVFRSYCFKLHTAVIACFGWAFLLLFTNFLLISPELQKIMKNYNSRQIND